MRYRHKRLSTSIEVIEVAGDAPATRSASEEIQEGLGRDLDEPAEPQNRGRPLLVVHQPVGRCPPKPKERGGLDEVENRGKRHRGIKC